MCRVQPSTCGSVKGLQKISTYLLLYCQSCQKGKVLFSQWKTGSLPYLDHAHYLQQCIQKITTRKTYMLEVNLTEQNIATIVQLSRCFLAVLCFAFRLWWVLWRMEGIDWFIILESIFFQLYLYEMWHTQISTDQYFEWYIWGLFPGVVLSLSFAAMHSVKFHYTKVKNSQTKNTYLHLLSLHYSNSSGNLHLLTLWLIWYVFRPSNISNISIFPRLVILQVN